MTYIAPASSSKTVTIPATYTINGKTYKVTKVAANAFADSDATKVVVGKKAKKTLKKRYKGLKNANGKR